MLLVKYPKNIKLKNGEEVMLRPMEKGDGESLFEFFKKLPEADRRFLRDDVTQRETIQRWISNIDYKQVLPILAFTKEGEIVGDGTLHMSLYGWSRHVGELRIVVAAQYQRQGLGRMLAKELIQNAVNYGLDKVVAHVMDNQKGALNAFTNIGFIPEATLRKHVTDVNGLKRDLVILSNHVESLWHQMEVMVEDYHPQH